MVWNANRLIRNGIEPLESKGFADIELVYIKYCAESAQEVKNKSLDSYAKGFVNL